MHLFGLEEKFQRQIFNNLGKCNQNYIHRETALVGNEKTCFHLGKPTIKCTAVSQ